MGATHLSGLSISPVTLAASTLTATEWDHAGRTIYLSIAGAQTITLPAASGTGNKFRFVVGVTATGDKVVQVANANDYMNGIAHVANDTDNSASLFETANTGTLATESDTVTLNGTTTGGYVGAVVECEDVAANRWIVSVASAASGAEATPFSAAVA
jgi:hypothetical protein